MKFRFVGGLDCPDWVLAEIAELSRQAPEAVENVSNYVAKRLRQGKKDVSDDDCETFKKLLPNLGLDRIQGCLSALDFIINKSVRNRCAAEDLEKEMLQLGMEATHAQKLRSVYEKEYSHLIEVLGESFFKEEALDLINVQEVQSPNNVKVLSCYTATGSSINLAISQQKLDLLKNELERAREVFKPYAK